MEWSDPDDLTSTTPGVKIRWRSSVKLEAGIDETRIRKASPEGLEFDAAGHVYTVLADREPPSKPLSGSPKPQDIVLIDWQGHEGYQILGNEKVPFDDRLAAIGLCG